MNGIYIFGRMEYEKNYEILAKKIPWYCFGKKRRELKNRISNIAAKKAAHLMIMLEKAVSDVEAIIAGHKLRGSRGFANEQN